MLSMTVARGWTYAGQDVTIVPILCAGLFSFSVVALAAASVARVRGTVRGCLVAIAILASPAFARTAPIQISDIPIGFFMLAAFVMLDRALESPSRRLWWALTGVAIGVAAWTKNEGLLFVIAAAIPIAIWAVRARTPGLWRSLSLIVLGTLPGLVAMGIFKVMVPQTNEIMAAMSFRRVLGQFGNQFRMRTIFESVGSELWFGGATIVGSLPIVAGFTAVTGVRRPLPIAAVLGLATMAIMLAGYVTIFATTPYNLGWHLKTSVDRLVVQLLPTLVWGALMIARDPRS
jgi:4-amino-4-deoxy-L-arabinose transferase-like glycosyltransferase